MSSMIPRPSKAGFKTVQQAIAAKNGDVKSIFEHDAVKDGDLITGLFDEESPSDLFHRVDPNVLLRATFPRYLEHPGDRSRFIANPQSAIGDLGNVPDDWFCGDGEESNEFVNLRSASRAYLPTGAPQNPVNVDYYPGRHVPMDRHVLDGRVPATDFVLGGQPTFTNRNQPNGFDSYGAIGSINVNRINGFASYGSPIDDSNIHRAGDAMHNYPSSYPSNDLDAYGTPMSIPPVSNGQFVPLYQDETAFLNRKASRMVGRVISDYPTNDLKAQHDIIARLYSAIRNTNAVQDSEKLAMKFNDDSIPDEVIHEACWEIMLKCRDSQELGSQVAKYHGTKHTEQNSFMERIDSVIATLAKSKAACKQALAPSFIERLVDQPHEELKRKSCNQKLNSKKTGQNKAGQQAIAKSMADAAGKWIESDVLEDEEVSQTMMPQATGDYFGTGDGVLTQQATEPTRKRARKN